MKINGWATLERGSLLQQFSYDAPALGPHDCLIRVLTCGICHSDIHMMDNDWGMSRYPLLPGHEVVGEVLERGREVQHLQAGDRVGVGWQRSACLQCAECLRGDENLCDTNQGLIVVGRGGFADHLVVDSRFAFPLPSGLDTRTTGPLLCGGITVFSALHHAGMTSGQEIGVLGVGGLGHLAVQFAAKLGNHVTIFTTSEDKARLAAELGAREAVICAPGAPPPKPRRRLDILLSTIPYAQDWGAYLEHLRADGTLTFVAVPPEPLTISVAALLFKRRRVMASPIGGRSLMVRMLSIADRFGIVPAVETFPLAQANEAIARVKANQVRYRAVLTVA